MLFLSSELCSYCIKGASGAGSHLIHQKSFVSSTVPEIYSVLTWGLLQGQLQQFKVLIVFQHLPGTFTDFMSLIFSTILLYRRRKVVSERLNDFVSLISDFQASKPLSAKSSSSPVVEFPAFAGTSEVASTSSKGIAILMQYLSCKCWVSQNAR